MSEAILEVKAEVQLETKIIATIEVAALKVGQAVRQGDVLVQRLSRKEFNAHRQNMRRRERRDLAVGVRHSHTALAPAICYETQNGIIWIESPARWELHHDEHACMVLPAGLYCSWRQVEFPATALRPVTVRD